jgi:hypothetical protein
MKRISILLLVLFFSVLSRGQKNNAAAGSDSSLILKTVLDYAEGFYSGDTVRMERAIHPDIYKVNVFHLPQGGSFLLYTTWSGLLELTRLKTGYVDSSKRNIHVTFLKVLDKLACVKMNSSRFDDYLGLVKINGQWKIINVLWANGPDSPMHSTAPFDPEREKPRVKGIVEDLVEGHVYGGYCQGSTGAASRVQAGKPHHYPVNRPDHDQQGGIQQPDGNDPEQTCPCTEGEMEE